MVLLLSRHMKNIARDGWNVFFFFFCLCFTRPRATPSMDFHRWTPFLNLVLVWGQSYLLLIYCMGTTVPLVVTFTMVLAFPQNASWAQVPSLFVSCLSLARLVRAAQPPPSSAACPSVHSGCLGQDPAFWLGEIDLNGCSSEFNDPC